MMQMMPLASAWAILPLARNAFRYPGARSSVSSLQSEHWFRLSRETVSYVWRWSE